MIKLNQILLTASDFVTSILTVEFHVAMERARNALIERLALEFVVTAWRSFQPGGLGLQ